MQFFLLQDISDKLNVLFYEFGLFRYSRELKLKKFTHACNCPLLPSKWKFKDLTNALTILLNSVNSHEQHRQQKHCSTQFITD